MKNKEARFSLIPAENRFAGRVWVGWGDSGGGGGVGVRGILFHRGKTTRKSHFSQCINLPRTDGRGGEGRNGGGGRGGDTEEDKVSGV